MNKHWNGAKKNKRDIFTKKRVWEKFLKIKNFVFININLHVNIETNA